MEHKPFLPELTENQIIIRDTIKDFAENNTPRKAKLVR